MLTHEDIECAALEYMDMGLSIIPVDRKTKKPLLDAWKPYQSQLADLAEVSRWFVRHPTLNLAFATGRVSNIVVVDADGPEAIAFCEANKLTSPIWVESGRAEGGRHYYFRHPGGSEVPNRGKMYGRKDLQLRGDGGYIIAPPSVHETGRRYAWHADVEWDDMPVWRERQLMAVTEENLHLFDFGDLDLSGDEADEGLDALGRLRKRVATEGRLRDGDGRNVALTELAGDLVAAGMTDAEVDATIDAAQAECFLDHLDPKEVATILRSVRATDRKNHPERYDANTGGYRQVEQDVVSQGEPSTLVPGLATPEEILATEAEAQSFLIEPWMPAPATIVQVYGFFSHGKSLFTFAAMWHLAQGRDFGPYRIREAARALYIDLDMSRRSERDRVEAFTGAFGPTGDNLVIFSQARAPDYSIDIRKPEGLQNFQRLLNHVRPRVVVIDNVRTFMPGMDENDSKAWAQLNTLSKQLRDAGIAVVLVHHANKASRDAKGNVTPGDAAGSGNQQTVLEVQLKVSRLDDTANEHRELCCKMEPHGIMRHAIHVSYGKVRDRDPELHEDNYLGFWRKETGQLGLCYRNSLRQRAMEGRRMGYSLREICDALHVTRATVEHWFADAQA